MAVGPDLHLVPEAHVVLDVLARHADIVGDLVDLVALLGARKDAGAAKAVNGGMVGIIGIDVPLIFLDLSGDPFLPAAAEDATFLCVGEPAAPAGAQAIGVYCAPFGE